MKKAIILIALFILPSTFLLAQSNVTSANEPPPKISNQMLQIKKMLEKNQKKMVLGTTQNRSQHHRQSSLAPVAVARQLETGITPNLKNVHVYHVTDSKKKIVQTQPIRNKKASSQQVQAMKAAFGIKN
jgi:hypothetical protein